MYQYSARGATGGSFRAKLLISQRMEFAWLVLTVALSVSSLSCVFACWLLGHPACPCATFPDCDSSAFACTPNSFFTRKVLHQKLLHQKILTAQAFHTRNISQTPFRLCLCRESNKHSNGTKYCACHFSSSFFLVTFLFVAFRF